MKIRNGGVLSRAGQPLTRPEQALLDGDRRAMRAVIRQALGVNTLTLPFREVELKAKADGSGGTRLVFTGYASVIDFEFEMADWWDTYTEVMRAGCFTRTLNADPDVIFCLNHNWDAVPMARCNSRMAVKTNLLEEDSTGLLNVAHLDGTRSDVAILQSAMEAEELDAMSLAFWVTQQSWSPDYDQRDIREVDMDGGDTSVVNWPANPGTTGTTSLRKRQALGLARSRVPALLVSRARAERRAAGDLDPATVTALQGVLDLIASADIAVDAAQPLLAELLGVPNPDADDEDNGDDTTDESDSLSKISVPGMSLARMRLLEDPALRTA